jgi:16S rRNA processing protein RimM
VVKPPKSDELFAVGSIVGCFGVKGYVRVRPESRLPGRMTLLHDMFAGPSASSTVRLHVEDVIERQGHYVLKFEGINDRNSAEAIVGHYLFVGREEAIPLPSGRYFVHDVIGCSVASSEGELLGVVQEVYKLPAQDVWLIVQDGRELLVPAVKEFIKSVDIAGKRIVVHMIEGLLASGKD